MRVSKYVVLKHTMHTNFIMFQIKLGVLYKEKILNNNNSIDLIKTEQKFILNRDSETLKRYQLLDNLNVSVIHNNEFLLFSIEKIIYYCMKQKKIYKHFQTTHLIL